MCGIRVCVPCDAFWGVIIRHKSCLICPIATFFFLFNFFVYILLLFKYSCLHFLTTTLLSHTYPPPTLNPTPLWLCPWVLYICSLMTLPLLSPLSPSPWPLWLLPVCSLFQCLWLYFCLLVCLFDWLASTYRWDLLWHFLFTHFLVLKSLRFSFIFFLCNS